MADQSDIRDNVDASRFEFTIDGQTGVLQYERKPGSLSLLHTEVPPVFRGQHRGEALVKYALATAAREGRQIIPICPFVKAYLQKHPHQE